MSSTDLDLEDNLSLRIDNSRLRDDNMKLRSANELLKLENEKLWKSLSKKGSKSRSNSAAGSSSTSAGSPNKLIAPARFQTSTPPPGIYLSHSPLSNHTSSSEDFSTYPASATVQSAPIDFLGGFTAPYSPFSVTSPADSESIPAPSPVKKRNSKRNSLGLGLNFNNFPSSTAFPPVPFSASPFVPDSASPALLPSNENIRPQILSLGSTDSVRSKSTDPVRSKCGWLAKKVGKGAWTTRYYILSEDVLSSYDDELGTTKLEEIDLSTASIGKQKSKGSSTGYQHAFLIRTHEEVDTILCAENEETSDLWIEAITRGKETAAPQLPRKPVSPPIIAPTPLPKAVSSPAIISGPSNAVLISEDFKKEKERKGKAKVSGFWGGFSKKEHVEKSPPVSVALPPPNLSFGISLSIVSNGPYSTSNLPSLVYRSLQYLDAHAAKEEEGIYRLSGSNAVIRELKNRFNAEGDVDLIHSTQFLDIHAVAGLLKTWLRELPSHILSRELQPVFVGILSAELEEREKMERLDQELSKLPIENFALIEALFGHLAKISDNSLINKMGVRNLAIVLSPSLAIPAPLFALILSRYTKQPIDAILNTPPADSTSLRLQPSPMTANIEIAGLESQEILAPPRSPAYGGLPNSPRDFSPSSN